MRAEDLSTVAVLRGVSKHLGGRCVLEGLDLAVRAGEVTALLGPNGAGKTTTVGIMTGRIAADTGEALLFGLDPRRPAARARMGVMLQSAGLPDVLTVAELVALQSGYYADPRPERETIALAGLAGFETRRAGALSGGEARRLQYALAICGRPDLLVLDEPTTGLDQGARRGLWSTVREEADSGAAILLTTHHLEEADTLADRIIVIADGRIIADGTPASIKASVAGSTIRCRTALTDARLAGLPGVRRAERSGADAVLLSIDAPATVRGLLDTDPGLHGLTIGAASLEEAFTTLTADAVREAA